MGHGCSHNRRKKPPYEKALAFTTLESFPFLASMTFGWGAVFKAILSEIRLDEDPSETLVTH